MSTRRPWRRSARASGTRRRARRDAPTRSVQRIGVHDEDLDCGERPERPERSQHHVRRAGGHDARDGDRNDVAGGRVPPHAPVDADHDEERVLRREEQRKRGEEHGPLELRAPCPPSTSRYATRNEPQMRTKSTTTSTRRRGSKTSASQTDRSRASALERERSSRSLRKLPNWTSRTKVTRTPIAVSRALSSTLYASAVAPTRRGHDREQEDGLRLREPVVDEAMRAVILPALGHRTPLGESHDRHEHRVEDRDGEDQQREEDRRERRPGDGPARCERKRREAEAERLAPGVAHEHGGRAPGPQVEGQERDAREAEGEREHEHRVVRVLRHRRRSRSSRMRSRRGSPRARPCCRAG